MDVKSGKGRVVAGWIAPHGMVPDMPAIELARERKRTRR
jgi:hypothetical protein